MKKKTGFTLIEVIVALGIFSILILVVLGTIVEITRVETKILQQGKLVEESQFLMELLTRELRTGYQYALLEPNSDLNSFCPLGARGHCLFFINQNESEVSFFRDENFYFYRYERKKNSTEITEEKLAGNSHEIRIQEMETVISGPNKEHESVTIILNITSEKNKERNIIEPIFTLQTTMTKRNYEQE